MDIFQYFRETSNLLLPSCRPSNRCYSPSNTTWFGHFLAKKWRHQTPLYSGFSGKIGKMEYLRRYFNRLTTSYKCGTMAHSICLIKLYQITIRKNSDFFFLTTLTESFTMLTSIFSQTKHWNSGFLSGIFSERGAKSIVMQIYIIMLIF